MCLAIFQTWKKSEKQRWSLEKMVKGLQCFFFFWKLQHVLYKWNIFWLVKSYSILGSFAAHHEKSFVPAFFRVSIDHLQVFDNCESGKWNYCFGKTLGKVLNFGSKNLYPESTSALKNSNLYLSPWYRIYWWFNVYKNGYSCWTITSNSQLLVQAFNKKN